MSKHKVHRLFLPPPPTFSAHSSSLSFSILLFLLLLFLLFYLALLFDLAFLLSYFAIFRENSSYSVNLRRVTALTTFLFYC